MSTKSQPTMHRHHAKGAQDDSTPASALSTDIAVNDGTLAPPSQPELLGPFTRITNSQALTTFQHDLTSLVNLDVAKELAKAMRVVMQQGNRRRNLLEPRRQKIRDIVVRTDNVDVEKLYNTFAKAHSAIERRSTFRLPTMGVDAKDKVGEKRVDSVGEDSRVREASLRVNGDGEGKMGTSEEVGMEGTNGAGGLESDGSLLGLSRDSDATATREAEEATSQKASMSSVALSPIVPMPTGITCDKHSDGACTLVPIQNPEDFPVERIQEVQAQYYPSTRFLDMWVHRDNNNHARQVTIDVDQGSADHLIIHDPQIIVSLGLSQPPYDTLKLQSDSLVDQTYRVKILPNQRPRSLKSWIVGELVTARHGYLYWLDSRQSADPRSRPTVSEARTLASQLKRRPFHVMQEIDRYWNLEQGSGGRHFRENREKHLGDNPRYPEGEEKMPMRSQWT